MSSAGASGLTLQRNGNWPTLMPMGAMNDLPTTVKSTDSPNCERQSGPSARHEGTHLVVGQRGKRVGKAAKEGAKALNLLRANGAQCEQQAKYNQHKFDLGVRWQHSVSIGRQWERGEKKREKKEHGEKRSVNALLIPTKPSWKRSNASAHRPLTISFVKKYVHAEQCVLKSRRDPPLSSVYRAM